MKIIKKKNLVKYLIPSIAAVVVAGTVGSVAGATTSRNNVNYVTNPATYSDNDSSMLMNNNQAKAASDADFLLNNDNAISLANSVEMQTSTSVTNGPRGFLSQVGKDIVYTGYDGKIIWSDTGLWTEPEEGLVSSHYNAYANCFVILYASSGAARVGAITEEDGQYMSILRPTFLSSDVNNYKRHSLVPIYETDNITVKAYYVINQYKGETKHLLYYSINNAGAMTYVSNKSGVPNTWGDSDLVWLAAGSINYGGNTYTAALVIGNSFGDWMILILKNLEYVVRTSFADNSSYFLTLENKWIDTNIREVYVKFDPADTSIAITAVVNADAAKTSIKPCQYTINTNSLRSGNIISLQQPGLDYDIYKGRIYGDYLYAYLGYADYGQSGSKNINKIMRLKLSDTTASDWNTAGLKWDGDYNNSRIILYNSPYNLGYDYNFLTLGLPIYSTDYNGKNNLFSFCASPEQKGLYLLDGGKNAYAYQTRLKAASNDFAIANVNNILVADAKGKLATYFTNILLEQGFTQYQSGSTYTVTEKTDSDSLIENKKGNIPATLEIDKAYDNASFAPLQKSFDIVLSGFKEASNTDIVTTTTSINLPDVYPYQTIDNTTITPLIKEFIINNILTGTVTDIAVDNVLDYVINAYDNKQGQLILDSITLNKWYDDNGDVQNTNKTFTLANNAKIEISGFKVVSGATNAVTNDVNVTGDLAALTTSAVTEKQLQTWIDTNQASIILNLPPEVSTIAISNIIKKSSIGKISFDATISSYYKDDAWYSYQSSSKKFTNITLVNFSTQDLATKIHWPTINVTGTLTNTLPQLITKENADFKQYLFDNAIDDPTKQLSAVNISDFTGTYNNTTGTYILNSISLDKTYDEDGNLLPPETFNNLGWSIQGFKAINSTATIPTILTIPGVNNISVLDNKVVSTIENWLKTDTNFNQAFTNLPDQFNANNIISLSIVADSIVASTGSLKVNIVINNYYANDTIATLTTTNSTPFELSITGFKTDSLATSVNVDPTATNAFPNAKNILAQNVQLTVDGIGLRNYLIQHVIIDPTNSLDASNISNISEVVANNINGTLSFKLEVNKRTDVDGKVINGAYTFTDLIIIKGFKTIAPTTATTTLAKGDNQVLANNVTSEQYTKVIKDNYQTIFSSLPDQFDATNIKKVAKKEANDKHGTLIVTVSIDLYYIETTGLITTSPDKTFEITISGYQSSLIIINNEFDIAIWDNSYRNKIAGAVLNSDNETPEVILNKWLRNDQIFKAIIIKNPTNISKNAFSVSVPSIKINNNAGTISVNLIVNGSSDGSEFVNNNNQLTFKGFRTATNINTWIETINETMTGSASSIEEQINDIKNQIFTKSKEPNSPFEVVAIGDIIVTHIKGNNFNITINKASFVDDKGVFITNTDVIPFVVQYQIKTLANTNSGVDSWVYPVIFSIVGLVAFLILLWIIIAIVKRRISNNQFAKEDDNSL